MAKKRMKNQPRAKKPRNVVEKFFFHLGLLVAIILVIFYIASNELRELQKNQCVPFQLNDCNTNTPYRCVQVGDTLQWRYDESCRGATSEECTDPRPQYCTGEYNPVCGSDHITYSNRCAACSNPLVEAWRLGNCRTTYGLKFYGNTTYRVY